MTSPSTRGVDDGPESGDESTESDDFESITDAPSRAKAPGGTGSMTGMADSGAMGGGEDEAMAESLALRLARAACACVGGTRNDT
jgi:hypothetical protein